MPGHPARSPEGWRPPWLTHSKSQGPARDQGDWPGQVRPRGLSPPYRALGQRSRNLLDVIHGVDPQGHQGLCDVLAYLGLQLPPGVRLCCHGRGLLGLRAASTGGPEWATGGPTSSEGRCHTGRLSHHETGSGSSPVSSGAEGAFPGLLTQGVHWGGRAHRWGRWRTEVVLRRCARGLIIRKAAGTGLAPPSRKGQTKEGESSPPHWPH